MNFKSKRGLGFCYKTSYILFVVSFCSIKFGSEKANAAIGGAGRSLSRAARSAGSIISSGSRLSGSLASSIRSGISGGNANDPRLRTGHAGTGGVSSSSIRTSSVAQGLASRLSSSSRGSIVSGASGVSGRASAGASGVSGSASTGAKGGSGSVKVLRTSHKYGVGANEFDTSLSGPIRADSKYVQFKDDKGKTITLEKSVSNRLYLLLMQDEVGRDSFIDEKGKKTRYIYRSSPLWVEGRDIINAQGGDGIGSASSKGSSLGSVQSVVASGGASVVSSSSGSKQDSQVGGQGSVVLGAQPSDTQTQGSTDGGSKTSGRLNAMGVMVEDKATQTDSDITGVGGLGSGLKGDGSSGAQGGDGSSQGRGPRGLLHNLRPVYGDDGGVTGVVRSQGQGGLGTDQQDDGTVSGGSVTGAGAQGAQGVSRTQGVGALGSGVGASGDGLSSIQGGDGSTSQGTKPRGLLHNLRPVYGDDGGVTGVVRVRGQGGLGTDQQDDGTVSGGSGTTGAGTQGAQGVSGVQGVGALGDGATGGQGDRTLGIGSGTSDKGGRPRGLFYDMVPVYGDDGGVTGVIRLSKQKGNAAGGQGDAGAGLGTTGIGTQGTQGGTSGTQGVGASGSGAGALGDGTTPPSGGLQNGPVGATKRLVWDDMRNKGIRFQLAKSEKHDEKGPFNANLVGNVSQSSEGVGGVGTPGAGATGGAQSTGGDGDHGTGAASISGRAAGATGGVETSGQGETGETQLPRSRAASISSSSSEEQRRSANLQRYFDSLRLSSSSSSEEESPGEGAARGPVFGGIFDEIKKDLEDLKDKQAKQELGGHGTDLKTGIDGKGKKDKVKRIVIDLDSDFGKSSSSSSSGSSSSDEGKRPRLFLKAYLDSLGIDSKKLKRMTMDFDSDSDSNTGGRTASISSSSSDEGKGRQGSVHKAKLVDVRDSDSDVEQGGGETTQTGGTGNVGGTQAARSRASSSSSDEGGRGEQGRLHTATLVNVQDSDSDVEQGGGTTTPTGGAGNVGGPQAARSRASSSSSDEGGQGEQGRLHTATLVNVQDSDSDVEQGEGTTTPTGGAGNVGAPQAARSRSSSISSSSSGEGVEEVLTGPSFDPATPKKPDIPEAPPLPTAGISDVKLKKVDSTGKGDPKKYAPTDDEIKQARAALRPVSDRGKGEGSVSSEGKGAPFADAGITGGRGTIDIKKDVIFDEGGDLGVRQLSTFFEIKAEEDKKPVVSNQKGVIRLKFENDNFRNVVLEESNVNNEGNVGRLSLDPGFVKQLNKAILNARAKHQERIRNNPDIVTPSTVVTTVSIDKMKTVDVTESGTGTKVEVKPKASSTGSGESGKFYTAKLVDIDDSGSSSSGSTGGRQSVYKAELVDIIDSDSDEKGGGTTPTGAVQTSRSRTSSASSSSSDKGEGEETGKQTAILVNVDDSGDEGRKTPEAKQETGTSGVDTEGQGGPQRNPIFERLEALIRSRMQRAVDEGDEGKVQQFKSALAKLKEKEEQQSGGVSGQQTVKPRTSSVGSSSSDKGEGEEQRKQTAVLVNVDDSDSDEGKGGRPSPTQGILQAVRSRTSSVGSGSSDKEDETGGDPSPIPTGEVSESLRRRLETIYEDSEDEGSEQGAVGGIGVSRDNLGGPVYQNMDADGNPIGDKPWGDYPVTSLHVPPQSPTGEKKKFPIASGGTTEGVVTLSQEWKDKIDRFKQSGISASNILSSLETGLRLAEGSGDHGKADQLRAVLKYFRSQNKESSTSIVQQSSSVVTSFKDIKTDKQ